MKNKGGFTLVEVIISIAALGIICAVLLRLFVVAGNTDKKAADVQSAQLVVTSTVETLAGADTLSDGLKALGIGGAGAGSYTSSSGSYEIIIDAQKSGDYPGKLYEISVKAESGGKVVASIDTAKYYKEENNG